MIKTDVVLEDPLSEKALPLFATKLGTNHHSPTQFAISDGAWMFKYCYMSQEDRRALLLGSSQMKAGVAVNNVLQNYYSDVIWKFGPHRKLQPSFNTKEKNKLDLINDEIIEFKNYEPVDEKDRQKKEKYLDEINSVIVNGFAAMDGLFSSHKVVSEEQISIDQSQSNLLLPIVGRTDFRFGNAGSGSLSSFLSSTTGIVELKTTWSKAGKLKVDGERSFIRSKIPAKPSFNHLVQCATYAAKYDFKVPVYLVYLNKDEYKIYDSNNCVDLTVAGLQRCFKVLCNTFRRREKILGTFEELGNKNQIIKAAAQVIDPNFDHPYAWSSLPHELLVEAYELWDQI